MAAFTERTIHADQGDLTAYDHGAHVAEWINRAVPVVWVSKRAKYVADQAIRGGIPVCWPWFANGPDGQRTPSHGLARTACWSLEEQHPDQLLWTVSAGDLPVTSRDLFAHEFDSTMKVTLGTDVLQVSHTVTNTGSDPFTYEIALHTYLHVGDVRDVHLYGLDSAGYFDKVAGVEATQVGPLRIAGEVDRIFRTTGPVRIEDPTLQRVITVGSTGAGNVVVWNPGPEGATQMSDFADHEWTQMVCVETANVDANAIRLEPGGTHATTVTLSVGA